jgi:serine/threonine-protein kinase
MAMMTAVELLQWLDANSFLTVSQVDELRLQISSFADGHALAKELIRRDWLTAYQVNQILQDKGASLIVGANRLQQRIGEGAMGQVFKAWNTRLGRTVAVKMIHKEHVTNQRAMDRFQQEMRSVGQLHHPNVLLVRDAGECAGRPYLVMDLIEGADLSKRVKKEGPLPVALAVKFTHQAALGLQHAYERGVVHRDIKPGNLLLTTAADGAPLVKIFDFGLSRLDGDTYNAARLTHAGKLIGTVDYMAPEQAEDAHTADTRADIYSLGCTLYFLLVGKPPFPGASIAEKLAARMIGTPPSVRQLRPEVPAGLDAVMQRMMARQPDERYATPQEAAEAMIPFTRLLAGEDVTATLTQTEIVEALAKRKIAMAVPVTGPVPAGAPIVQAMPVSQPISDASVPVVQATPVAMPAAGAAVAWAESTSTSTGAPFATPVAERLVRAERNWLFWGMAIVAAFLLVATVVIVAVQRYGPPGKGQRGHAKGAAVQFKEVQPMPITLYEGRKTPVIVTIQRKDFSGPVTVGFDKLPNGLQSEEITIKDSQDTDQLYLMASFNSGIRKVEIRLLAVAENVRDVLVVPVTVVTKKSAAKID